MGNTVTNPATPYVGPLPRHNVEDGAQIFIQGVAERHHNQFTIALQSGPTINPRDETPFVFNPRFNEGCCVRNTLSGGQWGHEERTGGMPFQQGQQFEVVIMLKHNKFKVTVNGRNFCEFNHRIPKERITHLIVEGGVRINFIRFEGGHGRHGHHGMHPHVHVTTSPAGGFQPPAPAYPPAGAYPGATGGQGPFYNPAMPFVQHIQGGLYPNRIINISGTPNPGASRFNVNFQCGGQQEPPDMGLHFDIRFNYGSDRNVLVRNSKIGGGWQTEDRHAPYFPFNINVPFDMMILIEPHCYKVAVNNQHLLEFSHKLPYQRIDTLRIDGDVRLSQVRFQ